MHIVQGFKLRPLGKDFILVGESMAQVNFNKMITMNETAAFLWQQVSDGSTFDAQRLAQLLCSEYDVDQVQALADAEQTLQTWLNAGVIE